MRALLPLDIPRHTAAALAVTLALAAGVALIATSGGGARPHVPARPRVSVNGAPAPPAYADTPAGAAAAATAWLQGIVPALMDGTWDRFLRSLATPAFEARLRGVQRVSTLAKNRVTSFHLPFSSRGWPLGYAVERFSSAAAEVRVWQLDVVDWGHYALTEFDTTTVSLAWIAGDWKIADSVSGPVLTPPAPNASASQIASWLTATDQFQSYTYAP